MIDQWYKKYLQLWDVGEHFLLNLFFPLHFFFVCVVRTLFCCCLCVRMCGKQASWLWICHKFAIFSLLSAHFSAYTTAIYPVLARWVRPNASHPCLASFPHVPNSNIVLRSILYIYVYRQKKKKKKNAH
jgi:hypothetical protein